jgi:hypothetical protein
MIDFNLNKKSPINNSEIELILQQIDILFDTSPKEVLGQETFGTQYDDYLYRLNLSNEGIEQRVLNDINSLELFGFKPHVEVLLLQGTERDIALIKILLTKDQESFEQIYKIQ